MVFIEMNLNFNFPALPASQRSILCSSPDPIRSSENAQKVTLIPPGTGLPSPDGSAPSGEGPGVRKGIRSSSFRGTTGLHPLPPPLGNEWHPLPELLSVTSPTEKR
jgi:hypothetical protein